MKDVLKLKPGALATCFLLLSLWGCTNAAPPRQAERPAGGVPDVALSSSRARHELVREAIGDGPFAVGSSFLELEPAKVDQLATEEGFSARSLASGAHTRLGIPLGLEAMAADDAGLIRFHIDVPSKMATAFPEKSHGSENLAFLLYPTGQDNGRPERELWKGAQKLPHAQGRGEMPLWEDLDARYPLPADRVLPWMDRRAHHPPARAQTPSQLGLYRTSRIPWR